VVDQIHRYMYMYICIVPVHTVHVELASLRRPDAQKYS